MQPCEIAASKIRYAQRFREYGCNHQALGWKDKASQLLRFRVLQELTDLSGKKILDVGCGLGDFYKFLVEQGLEFHYTGYDLCDVFVAEAQQRFPAAVFEARDIQDVEACQQFDLVYLSGVLNYKIRDNWRFMERTLAKMFQLARLGLAANMMTDYVDFKAEDLFYYSPEQVFSFCKTLSSKVILRHDYPLYEFTVYLYRDMHMPHLDERHR